MAFCTVQPTPSAFIRRRFSTEASFQCAIDQRSPAIGASWFTRLKISRSWPAEALRGQCIVSAIPCCAAHRAIS
jgi:hypothetical protein